MYIFGLILLELEILVEQSRSGLVRRFCEVISFITSVKSSHNFLDISCPASESAIGATSADRLAQGLGRPVVSIAIGDTADFGYRQLHSHDAVNQTK